MRVLTQKLERLLTELSVLILGETGTGKGARGARLHKLSPREADRLSQSIALQFLLPYSNRFCSAMNGVPSRGRAGSKENSCWQRGHALLDEIGDCRSSFAKLLRVSRRSRTLGAEKPVRINVRVVAATLAPASSKRARTL